MGKFLTALLLFTLLACQSESRNQSLKVTELVTPAGEVIRTTIALTAQDQEKGLSGVRPEDFEDNEAMLFYYFDEGDRHFWMPDTYFDLDLFYLDKDFKIVDIVRKLPHYKGRANPELIPRARGVWCRHTLEMKSGSKIASGLKVGDFLRWKNPQILQQIESKTHQQQ
jgi:uncharacterized protein